MLYSSSWGFLPGIRAVQETYETEFRWGPAGAGLITGGVIDAGATDPGNTPTYELRKGLVLGRKTASGNYTNYSSANTDGSEVAVAVLISNFRVQDILTGAGQQLFYGILAAGPVQAAKLWGLDLMARAQMADHFAFDDSQTQAGTHWFPWMRFQNKTANYQVVIADNFSLFDITNATGAVTFTLPAIQNGLYFGFRGGVAQNLAVTSNEGANMITLNSLVSNTITFSTGGQQIGALAVVYSNPAGTKWIVENRSAGAATITAS